MEQCVNKAEIRFVVNIVCFYSVTKQFPHVAIPLQQTSAVHPTTRRYGLGCTAAFNAYKRFLFLLFFFLIPDRLECIVTCYKE